MSFGVLDGDGNVAQIEGHPFGRIQFTGVRYAQADIRLLSPILPSKVVGIGKNYAEHVAEMNTGDAPKEPLMFLKPSTSVIGPEDAIRIPPGSTNVHHEVEQALQLGVLVPVGGGDVDVQAQLPGLGLGHPAEDQRRGRTAEAGRGADLHLAVLARQHPVVQHRRPERGEGPGVAAVDDDLGEAAGHVATIGRPGRADGARDPGD